MQSHGLRRALLASVFSMATASACWGQALPSTSSDDPPVATSPVEDDPTAQATELEEVVVQARRVSERQQAVPVATTVVSGDRLEQAAATSTQDIQRLVPATQIVQDSSGQQVFTIRGSFGGVGNDPAVITYIDDVPIDSLSIVYSLFDLQSVQVLRGSQGTLFGRNSTGGAFLFFNRRPDLTEPGGYVTGRYGNLNDRRLEGAFNLPFSDTFGVRVAGEIQERDGTRESVTVPGLDFGNRDNQALRVSALWEPNDDISNYTQVTHYRQRENAPAQEIISLAGPCTGPATPAPVCLYQPPFTNILGTGNIRAFFEQEQALPERLTVNSDPNTDNADRDSITNTFTATRNGITFRNTTYLGDINILFSKDYDGTPVNVFNLVRNTDIRSFYTESQLSGLSFDDRLNWRVGTVYSDDEVNQTSFTSVFALPVSRTQPRTGIADQKFRSTALFAQGTLDLSQLLDGLSFTAGYRYTWDDRDLDFQVRTGQPVQVCALQVQPVPVTGPVPFPGTDLATCTRKVGLAFDDYNYNLTVDYKPTDRMLFYASARRGYKSGSFNLLSNEANLTTYAPEIVEDLEAGFKIDFKLADIPFRTNLAIFRSDYTNIQVSTVRINPANGDINVLILNQNPITGESNQATIEGYELEALVRPLPWLQLSGFYSELESVYDRFTVPGTTTNLAGQNVAGVIPRTYGLSALAEIPIGNNFVESIDLTASYYLRDAPQTNATTTQFTTERTSIDGRVVLRNLFSRDIDLAAYVINLDDVAACTINTSVSGGPARICGDPRTYGLELTYRFGSERRR